MTKTKKIILLVTSCRFMVAASLSAYLLIWFSFFLTYNNPFSSHRRFMKVVASSAIEGLGVWAIYTFIGLIIGVITANFYHLYERNKNDE